ncbi:type II toxin-antitoxin system VapC family toxin [Candidatus Bathyarchaeota archaeon]|nr:type II toxin-antitoxin system VapC family toxin [Candidatus Bathyarchaeota archaeon]
MKIFIDTSAIIAYYNVDDRFHQEASRVMGEVLDGKIPLTRLYVSDYVFDESVTFMKCVLGTPELAERVGNALLASSFTSILKVDEEVFDDAWVRFKKSTCTSFTDCTSFALMDKYGIRTAFTYDGHFAVAGYNLL